MSKMPGNINWETQLNDARNTNRWEYHGSCHVFRLFWKCLWTIWLIVWCNHWYNKIRMESILWTFSNSYKQTPRNICLDKDVLKMAWSRLSSSSSEDVFKTSSRCLDQAEYIRLGHASSRRLQNIFKTFSKRLQNVLLRCLQHVFKTSWRRLAKTSWKNLEDVFKTSARGAAKISSRHLQEVFKTSSGLLHYVFKMHHH